jgi:hypothetical protein
MHFYGILLIDEYHFFNLSLKGLIEKSGDQAMVVTKL